MPYLTGNEIEAIAQRVVTAYRKMPALDDGNITAVDPELLAEELLGLTVEYHRLSPTGQVHGLTVFGDAAVSIYDDPEHPDFCFLDGKTILIEKELQENSSKIGRRHFTIAHEASHQIYRMLFPKAYRNSAYFRTIHYYTDFSDRSPNDWEEWRTNVLAAAILMPADLLRRNMAELGLGEKIHKLHQGDSNHLNFIFLAHRMGVSTQALAIRMQQLGLLEHCYLRWHPVNITAVVEDNETL